MSSAPTRLMQTTLGAIALWGIASTPAHATIVPGDINLDGSVNLADPITLLTYLFSGGTIDEEGLLNADVNLSGNVNAADAVYLFDHLFGVPAGPAPLHPPYCRVLDPSGVPVEPPQYEPGTYWTDSNGVPFAGGFVADTAWPNPTNPTVGITNPNVVIPRGASVCGDTRISSTGSGTVDVVLEDTATIRDSQIEVVSPSSGALSLRLTGNSIVSETTLLLEDVFVVIEDSTVSDGAFIHSESGSVSSEVIIVDSDIEGSEIHMMGGDYSPMRIEQSSIQGGVLEGSNELSEPVLIIESTLQDVDISFVWDRIDILSSHLTGTWVTGLLGDTFIDSALLVDGGEVTGSEVISWCGDPGQVFIAESCNGINYNAFTCSHRAPFPAWPDCN